MIDLHCHILPGMDDGARLLEESLDMARTAVENNIYTIVATPHTLNGFYINKWEDILSLTSTVQKALDHENIPIRLLPGMEIQLCPELFDALSEGRAVTINDNSRYLLLEFPPFSMPVGSEEFIIKLKRLGITPVIAHPERNLVLQNDLNMLFELVKLGALYQLTASSIIGYMGPFVQKSAVQMLRSGLAHVIATDAHANDERIIALSAAVKAAAEILQDYPKAQKMVTSTPAAIIAGDEVVVDKPSLDIKRWWVI